MTRWLRSSKIWRADIWSWPFFFFFSSTAVKDCVNPAFALETRLVADPHHLSAFTEKETLSFFPHVWGQTMSEPASAWLLLELCLVLSCSFYLSKQNDFVFFHTEEMIQGQSISQECKNWMWEISWKFPGHLRATVTHETQSLLNGDVTFDVAPDGDTKKAKPGLFGMAFAFEETHSYGS